MIFPLVVVLSLSWPHVTRTENANVQDRATFDRIATASENVAKNVDESGQRQMEFRDTAMRYENSNGFVPMLVSPSSMPSERFGAPEIVSFPTVSGRAEAEKNEPDETKDDPARSTEVGILLNFSDSNADRRSFAYRDARNDFELLKVNNDTPIVADYPNFYRDSTNSDESDDEKNRFASGRKSQGKRRKVENYMGNYDESYGHRYSNDLTKDKEGESIRGQSAIAENAPTFPRTDRFEGSAKIVDDSYDTVPSSSRVAQNHKFSRPVVVADPNYKYPDPDADDYQTSRAIDTVSSEITHRYAMDNRDGRFRSDEDSGDASDYSDYREYTERPTRVRKGKRRPSDSPKRLPKEHRSSRDDSTEYEGQGKRHRSSRPESHRQRATGSSWTAEENDSYEDSRRVKSRQNAKFNPNGGWNQISPNLEISHSSGIEIGQLEKPKLVVPVNVNLVPLANNGHVIAATPLINTVESITGRETKGGVSTPVPDVVLGHDTLSDTVSPIYAVTPNFDSTVQSVPNRDVQAAATPRPTYVGASNQLWTNHLPQLLVPRPTIRTVPALVQTAVASTDYVQVSPHGMHGQNPVRTVSTAIPIAKFALLPSESQNKKTFSNFLATASLSVGDNDQRQTSNGDPYRLQNSNSQRIAEPQVEAGPYRQAPKNLETTHLLPAVLHPVPTLATISAATPQTFVEQQSVRGIDQGQRYANFPKDYGYPSLVYQTIDSTGGHRPAASGIGTRNVEILNPNIKPSPVDTAIVNSYETMHYPTAVLTTPIPMFTTTSFVTARPSVLPTSAVSTNFENPTNPFTETKNNQPFNGAPNAYQYHGRPMYDPIDFVPNIDVLKNQNALNGKLRAGEPLQQNLNLVPLIPGGNFFRPSYSAQSELSVKPKLASDLETYADQMFKESLKTIYNSQKWNNDRKTANDHRYANTSDALDIVKLKNELQRLKASLFDSKRNKDRLEGHHSETKLRTAEYPEYTESPESPESPDKKPDKLLAALEQMLKNRPIDSLRNFQESGKPRGYRGPGDHDGKRVRDFLTPPQPNSHRSKVRFHDKPGKKKPGLSRHRNHSRYHERRPYPRSNLSSKVGGPDTSASNIDPLRADDFLRQDGSSFDSSFDSYSTRAAGSSFDKSNFLKGSRNRQGFDGKENVYNHPRTHNLLGLMKKNRRLPNGNAPSYIGGRAQSKRFLEDERRRRQRRYPDTSEDTGFEPSNTDTRRSLSEKSSVLEKISGRKNGVI